MRKLGKRWVISLSLIVLLLPLLLSPEPTVAQIDIPDYLNVGPYVDKVVYKVIANQDQRILALQAGVIEMDLGFIDSVNLSTLDADPDIDIFEAVRNGYGYITINCDKYPLNISGFRRAFAFAFDKERVTSEIFDGYSIEHDSLVPAPNGWCIEDELDWHYYTNQSDRGNQILDNLGLIINPGTGFRRTPNEEPFHVSIRYNAADSIAGEIAHIGVDALHSLHIDADAVAVVYNEYLSRLTPHCCYDMVVNSVNFSSNNVDWLAHEFWSEHAGDRYLNPSSNFRNATFDSWRDQLLNGTTYEEVYEASAEMQRILHYNVPRLVVYENTFMQAYRTDVFTGHVPDLGQYITGRWTMRKIHKLDGTQGGTVTVGISQEPVTFNIFTASTPSTIHMLEETWPSLYVYAPDLTPHPYLADKMIIETHEDNSAVPDGRTRFTVDIIQNATWTDGTPITAEDVAFTFAYAIESGHYENPALGHLTDLQAAYAPTHYRVVLEFNTESYWHFSNFAFDFVIPKHIFNDVDGIGYEGWESWDPVFDPAEPTVNCGPFDLTDFERGEFYELTGNSDFAYYEPPTVTDHSAFRPHPPRSRTEGPIISVPLLAAVSILSSGFILVIVVMMFYEIQVE